MDVYCQLCEHRWDSAGPGVRPVTSEVWVCDDEGACIDRAVEALS